MQFEWQLDPEYRRPALIGAGVVLAGALAYWWFSAPVESTPMPQQVVTVQTDVESTAVLVHVTGDVRNPGVVRLPAGSRVIDAVEAAGGLRPRARVSVNLARVLVDGEQIVVGASPAAPTDARMSINSASASELEALPGVGPVLAQRIVEYRNAHGPFASMRDLLQVPGIGDSKYAELADAATL